MNFPLFGWNWHVLPSAISTFVLSALSALVYLLFSITAHAHGVAEGDKGYIQEMTGVHLLPFTYLGAKHMMTGYDHLLFLFGLLL